MTTLQPPKSLIIEIPGREGGCPMHCRHCIHRNLKPSGYPALSREEIVNVLLEGREMGIECVNIYPHNDELCLPPFQTHEYIRAGHKMGFKIKTVTNGINPAGVEPILPYTYRLAISVDAIDAETYGEFRDRDFHKGLLETLTLLKKYKDGHPSILLTALVVVSQTTIDTIEQRVETISRLDLFTKIRLIELLPIGGAEDLAQDALFRKHWLDTLARLKKAYYGKLYIGTPLWRVKNEQRGCQLGYKDIVIGPEGQISGCTLLLYLNQTLGNLHDAGSLTEIWNERFNIFRQKETALLSEICSTCEFYAKDLCWGGCRARALIFGPNEEINRSCGIKTSQGALRLFQIYQETCDSELDLAFPVCIINDSLYSKAR